MQNYFTYLPPSPDTLKWGVAVTSAGFIKTPPDSPYPDPKSGHPPDHMFSWQQGRILDNWQLLYIQEGSGWFESKLTGKRRVKQGTIFILFPGIWHRYAPDAKTGWAESWLEFQGAVPEQLRTAGILQPNRAVSDLGSQPELAEALNQCHSLAQNLNSGYGSRLATSALQVLSLALSLRDQTTTTPRHIENVIRRARTLLTERCDQPLQIKSLAKELGIAESYFRRSFKAHTGLSPKQYLVDIRLRRVRALLQNPSLTITEIADQMGYHSPFHLSSEFKKHTGSSPLKWRRRLG